MKRSQIVTLLIGLVLLLDQAIKFYIKTHFEYNQDVPMLGQNCAKLHFVENEGMAFGITFGWEYGKLLLSLFRIGMVAALIWYIRLLLRVGAPSGFIYSVGLITAGALGNIIDSAFYGLIFTESPYHGGLAELVPIGQGYGTFLHGKVVDMLYFPIKWISIPDNAPFWGGEDFLFFSPIFNIADASITCGVLAILLFQRRFFRTELTAPTPVALAGHEAGEETMATEKQEQDWEDQASQPTDREVAQHANGTEAPGYVEEEEAPAEAKKDEPTLGI